MFFSKRVDPWNDGEQAKDSCHQGGGEPEGERLLHRSVGVTSGIPVRDEFSGERWSSKQAHNAGQHDEARSQQEPVNRLHTGIYDLYSDEQVG